LLKLINFKRELEELNSKSDIEQEWLTKMSNFFSKPPKDNVTTNIEDEPSGEAADPED